MRRSVRWQERALEQLRTLAQYDRATAGRIHASVDRFAEGGVADVKKLQGTSGEWRLRVGDWRVRFRVDPDDGAIVVLRVLPRGRAYRD